jgi:uncharacterized protein (DUF697 family)
MTLQLGKIQGYEVTQERAHDVVKEVAAAAGTTLLVQGVISAIGKISPFTRALLSFPVTYASTWALGRVVEYYFDCMTSGREPEAAVMKDLFAAEFKIGKQRGQAFDQDDMKARAEELRRKVAARDPSLTTETRLEPRPMAAAASPPGGAGPVASQSGERRKIKITLTPKPEGGDDAPSAQDASPADPGPAHKTIGGDDEPEVQIGFAKAAKTLGEEGDELSDPPSTGDQGSADEPAGDTEVDALIRDVPQPPPATAPAEDPEVDAGAALVERLERLGALRTSGVLTQEEFEQAKAKLLGRG